MQPAGNIRGHTGWYIAGVYALPINHYAIALLLLLLPKLVVKVEQCQGLFGSTKARDLAKKRGEKLRFCCGAR